MTAIYQATRSATPPLVAACNNTLYYLDICKALPAVRDLVDTGDNSELTLYPGHRCAIQLCLLYHMRIGETLSLRVSDELSPSMWLCSALKGGRAYTIHVPVSPRNRTILNSMPPDSRLFPFSYSAIWRSMIKAGMSLRVSGRVNQVVTHRGRFDIAEKLQHLDRIASVTDVLHHKSSTSREYYLRGRAK